jgi:hypothetical protein
MKYLAAKIWCLALLVLLIVSFTSKAEARNEYLNNGSNDCRYGDMDISVENYRGNTDYIYGDSDYESDNYNVRLTFRKYLGISKKDCEERNEITLENENLKQELEMLKVCQRYADRPLPPQFSTVEKHCKGLRATPKRVKEEEPAWDKSKKEWVKENPDIAIYNTEKKTLKMPPKDFVLPEPGTQPTN